MALSMYTYGAIGVYVLVVIALIVYFVTRKKSDSSSSSGSSSAPTASPTSGPSSDTSTSSSAVSEMAVTDLPEKYFDPSKYYAIQNQNTKDVLDYNPDTDRKEEDPLRQWTPNWEDRKYYTNQGFYYEPKTGTLASCHKSGVALSYDKKSDKFLFTDLSKITKSTVSLLDIGNDLFCIVSADRTRVLSNPGNGKLFSNKFVKDKISVSETFAAVDISPDITGIDQKTCYKL